MAVRDDFAPGEVLAAADLNDTFASKLPYSYGTATPSTTTSGFLWYDSNSTPPIPKYWNGSAFGNLTPSGGLELIDAETFSAVSSVSINNCFSSTYQNYLVLINGVASTYVACNIRLRVSGSDNSTANSYRSQRISANSTTVGGLAATNSFLEVCELQTTKNLVVLHVFSPFEATVTNTHTSNQVYNGALLQYGGSHNQATSYDGFTFYPASGTTTGTIRIYGYKD
jgi:hypothetical protein